MTSKVYTMPIHKAKAPLYGQLTELAQVTSPEALLKVALGVVK